MAFQTQPAAVDVKLFNRWALDEVEALEHLASIDLIELCNEAKIEHCRATRDLSSCGRYVQHVLNSCGHASLCAECSQRCDVCPICRTSVPNSGNKIRLRLYHKCIEAGLISKRCDERLQDKDEGRGHRMADIQRLYSLFDVALDNNLVSLICHYVTDVCMDENAVSSDPVLAFLLDEVVVKDWCNQTFNRVICDLQKIYCLGVEEMKSKLSSLQKLASHLTGISNVLEVMVSSFKESYSGQLHDMHYLMESTLKAKQHLEIMVWCIRHQFLEKVQSQYPNYTSWNYHFCKKKAAADARAWPESSTCKEDSPGLRGSTLFIEEALSNLGIDQDYPENESSLSFLRSRTEETDMTKAIGSYPFESIRVAADVLFLHGTSDMVVAKRAIFLYYLFDRHGSRPDVEWRHLIDDFAASFCLSRQAVLESFTFYLLDDHTDQATQEAIHLLPEIAGPETHPKISQVLLERQHPDVALTVLRCAGRDGLMCFSLDEAIIGVRIRIECGLLTETFMYQRMHCSKVKELGPKNKSATFSKSDSWIYQVEVLVTEFCHLCIRRNLVDRMIELPWNSDEEKFLHKCLYEHACENPASISGSLLVVFYLQRYRYAEAFRMDSKIQGLEHNVFETADEDVVHRVKSISHWRAGLVGKCIELLPKVQRQHVLTDSTTDDSPFFSKDIQTHDTDFTKIPPGPVTLLTPSTTKPPLILQKSFKSFPSRKSPPNVPINFTSSVGTAQLDLSKRAPSILQHRLLASLGKPGSKRNSLVDVISSPAPFHNGDYSLTSFQSGLQRKSVRDIKGTTLKVPQNGHHLFPGENTLKLKKNSGQVENFRPHDLRIANEDLHDPMDISHSNGCSREATPGWHLKTSQNHSGSPWSSRAFPDDATHNTGRSEKRNSPVEDSNARSGSRWRSDESSEDEVDRAVDRPVGSATHFGSRRRARFSRR